MGCHLAVIVRTTILVPYHAHQADATLDVKLHIRRATHYTENKRLSFWQLCRHWWHRKFSLRQLTVPAVMIKLSNWRCFVFSVEVWRQQAITRINLDFPSIRDTSQNNICKNVRHLKHEIYLKITPLPLNDSLNVPPHWKSRVAMKPTLSPLLAWQVVITTTSRGNSDDKVGIMTTVGFNLNEAKLKRKCM